MGIWNGGEFGWTEMTVGGFHDEVLAEADGAWSMVSCDYGEP